MIARVLVVLWLTTLAVPVLAQTSPPPGVLRLPSKTQSAPEPPHRPPSAAPVTTVQQVAPMSTPAGKPVHAKKPTPVVRPSHASHAEKPPKAKAPAKPVSAPATAPPPMAKPPAAKPDEPDKGTVTGLPLPRWASLRSDDVNLRAGPGTRYPIDWVYHRRGLPVEIEREFEVWRLIRDEDGVRGWVHEATLTGRRAFVVEGQEHALRSSAADTASPVALLKPGVIGHIRLCPAGKDWCELQVGDYRGWMKRADVWGTFPGEAVN